MTASLFMTAAHDFIFYFTSRSHVEVSVIAAGRFGHSLSGFFRNSGPINHCQYLSRPSAERPLYAW